MPKILVNYSYNKKKNKYNILESDVVFAELPVALMDMDMDTEDILVVPIQGKNTVVDRKSYLEKHQLFRLTVNEDGTIKEDPNGAPIWLPKETKIPNLRLMNGQLVLIKEEEVEDNG